MILGERDAPQRGDGPGASSEQEGCWEGMLAKRDSGAEALGTSGQGGISRKEGRVFVVVVEV